MPIKRQTIINAVKTRLQTILTAGGYYTNLGSHVDELRVTVYQQSELPAVSIVETGNENLNELASNWIDQYLNIEFHITVSGNSSAADIRKAIYDVLKAIGTDDTWSGNAIQTHYVNDELKKAGGEILSASAIVRIKIKYRTNIWSEA